MEPLQTVLHYHERTKHHPHRYAQSLGYLDWANQPDPFRRFHGAPIAPLLLTDPVGPRSCERLPESSDAGVLYDDLYSPGIIAPRPRNLESISQLLQYSLALSAWKEYGGSRWALRINPSSGNLHPTEGYLIAGPVDGLSAAAGVYHYAPKDHVLEQRCRFTAAEWDKLVAGFPPGTLLAGLSSIHWREAWKYGERAYRYCQHDVGHALAALCLSAAIQGWRVHPLPEVSDATVAWILGLDRVDDFKGAEREHPDLLMAIVPSAEGEFGDLPGGLDHETIASIRSGPWFGQANRLSVEHVNWEWIDRVADACTKPSTPPIACVHAPESPPPLKPVRPLVSARRIIHQRRSAVAMDGRTGITAEQFYLMMDRAMPRFDRPPWNGLGPPACVHLALFVHRVEELVPGLYFLVRTPDGPNRLREATRPNFDWERPSGCPATLPLYHLKSGDVRAVAGQVSCGQGIAADGAFSLGMIAEFEPSLRAHGAYFYRRLFWETGAIGQVLYLEAEAAGIRSTGIGCYFDDLVHEIFGFTGRTYQSLYHFTVGGPVEDTRLTTIPPYPS